MRSSRLRRPGGGTGQTGGEHPFLGWARIGGVRRRSDRSKEAEGIPRGAWKPKRSCSGYPLAAGHRHVGPVWPRSAGREDSVGRAASCGRGASRRFPPRVGPGCRIRQAGLRHAGNDERPVVASKLHDPGKLLQFELVFNRAVRAGQGLEAGDADGVELVGRAERGGKPQMGASRALQLQ